MLLDSTIRLLALVLGAGLSVFLALLFVRKRAGARSDHLALAALVALGAWQASKAIAGFHGAVAERSSSVLLGALAQVETAALVLIPAILLHLSTLWSGARVRGIAAVYLTVPPAWWALESGRLHLYEMWFVVAISASAALCAWGARRFDLPAPVRRFLAVFTVALLAPPAADLVLGRESAAVAIACLAPPLALTWWIYRYNLFGVVIRPRLIFALKMGFVFAVYLLIVRALARLAQEEFEAFGALVELALIFAAAVVWLPLYSWMSRFLSRRTNVYANFSKRLIEDAARILDLRDRVQFLAEEVGRTFGLNGALLMTGDDAALVGRYGSSNGDVLAASDGREKLFRIVRMHRVHTASATAAVHPDIRQTLLANGYNYLFALWYEDRLNGLLLLDTSPRRFLDEDEPILEGLSGQISHSLETGRVIAEKIELERRLAHQQHLAALGRAAATIAHEVKNPLSSIKTLAQVMREDPEVDSRHSRDLHFILGEVDRLNATVQQLLTFARPMSRRPEEVHVSESLALLAEVLAREYATTGIRIEQSIEPQLRLRTSSTEALQQTVLNLLLNAIQVSPPGSTVRLEAFAAADGKIAVTVCDRGPGIPSEVRARMFEPFFTTRHKGTGLGLAIVRKNVEDMRGAVAVESPLDGDRGAKFTVMLPCD